MSLAPSPTATLRSRFFPAQRRTALAFAAASTTGPTVRPVSRPFLTSSRFASTWSIPRRLVRGSRTSMKPPETTPNLAPTLLVHPKKSSEPGVRLTEAPTFANVLAGRPSRSATRSASDPEKSRFPAIASAVISATWSPTPATSARQSMTSSFSSVESASVTTSVGGASRRASGSWEAPTAPSTPGFPGAVHHPCPTMAMGSCP